MLWDHRYGASVYCVAAWCVRLHPSFRWYQVILRGDRGTCVWQICLRPTSHLQFYHTILHATLSCDIVAVCNCACRTLQPCCININKNWPISIQHILTTKIAQNTALKGVVRLFKSCATRNVTLAILSLDKVARQNCKCDIGLRLLPDSTVTAGNWTATI